MSQTPIKPHLHLVPEQYRKAPLASELKSNIEFKQFSLQIENQQVFTPLSLPIYKNHINALIGPSGCGKSSLLHSVIRLIDYDDKYKPSGEILINQQNIFEKNIDLVELRKKVAMIFQKPVPFPMSIQRNFEIPLKEHGIKNKAEIEAKMESALKRVGLWDEVKSRLHKNANNLSGGQQQRLCIARALSLEPETLLLDEPCSALDPVATRVIEELLVELKESYTVLIVTHNLSQAKRIADYVAFMWYANDCGKLIEHNSADVIFTNPSNPLTNAYVQGMTD